MNLLGETVQIYTTKKCGMNCPHCSSRTLNLSEMTMDTFREVVGFVSKNGCKRLELFANDPVFHNDITKQIGILNESSLDYAILTVGANRNIPASPKAHFMQIMDMINPAKGGFVFSVDYSEQISRDILSKSFNAYAYKALSFWQLAPILQDKKIPVRINVVVSKDNVNEVLLIIQRAAEMGFAVSFCFVQYHQPKFLELIKNGLTSDAEEGFRSYLTNTGFFENSELDGFMNTVRGIVANELKNGPFNKFRGSDAEEGNIQEGKLIEIRKGILLLKTHFNDQILPGDDFINGLGGLSTGCLNLLKQGKFPQMKIGSNGEMLFCCDLHDPKTSNFTVDTLNSPQAWESFLTAIRKNPYVLLCSYFNRCDFSVNHVMYNTFRK